MFGYLRPYKPDLLMREWSRWKAVYCGLCKQIGRDYGQLPRLAVSYELTFLALLLLALREDDPGADKAGCLLDPRRKPSVRAADELRFCAGLAVLLAYFHGCDDRKDGQKARALAAAVLFHHAARRAARQPDDRLGVARQKIEHHLFQLRSLEQGPPDLTAADLFGDLLQDLFALACSRLPLEQPVRQAFSLAGRDIGRWIYLADAIDDWQRDKDNGNWNPLADLSHKEALATAAEQMMTSEAAIDRTLALLPYRRDGNLIGAIVTIGLPEMRQLLLSGRSPGRL